VRRAGRWRAAGVRAAAAAQPARPGSHSSSSKPYSPCSRRPPPPRPPTSDGGAAQLHRAQAGQRTLERAQGRPDSRHDAHICARRRGRGRDWRARGLGAAAMPPPWAPCNQLAARAEHPRCGEPPVASRHGRRGVRPRPRPQPAPAPRRPAAAGSTAPDAGLERSPPGPGGDVAMLRAAPDAPLDVEPAHSHAARDRSFASLRGALGGRQTPWGCAQPARVRTGAPITPRYAAIPRPPVAARPGLARSQQSESTSVANGSGEVRVVRAQNTAPAARPRSPGARVLAAGTAWPGGRQAGCWS
jgi:hypothetical protein